MRRVLYMAHPVAPTEAEILDRLPSEADEMGIERWEASYGGDVKRATAGALRVNLERAMQWLSWLRKSFPETTFIAPWIADISIGADDSDPAQRERGLVDCCAVVERCDGIVLVGPRISTGMARERDHGLAHGYDDSSPEDPVQTFGVYDLTSLAAHPDRGGWSGTWMDSDRGAGTCPAEFADWAETFRA